MLPEDFMQCFFHNFSLTVTLERRFLDIQIVIIMKVSDIQIVIIMNIVTVLSVGIKRVDCINF